MYMEMREYLNTLRVELLVLRRLPSSDQLLPRICEATLNIKPVDSP